MKATYVNHMGNDLSVVNAARVSFNKTSSSLSGGDEKLIKYLADHGHWTPFGHTALTVHFKAPLFVARQLGKHQVGLVWNEVSRRYVSDKPEFYKPDEWRKKPEGSIKQGSSTETTKWGLKEYNDLMNQCEWLYEDLLEMGVCPEQARMVLPQSMYTEWYWTGNLQSFSSIYNLRTKDDTQKETRELVKQLDDIIQPLFPVSWKELTK